VRRPSLRVRLTLAFVVGTALVFLAAGAFFDLRLRAELDHDIDAGLNARSRDLAALVRQSDSGLREAPRAHLAAGDVAQVIDPRGRVIDATSPVSRRPLLAGVALAHARRGRLVLGRTQLPGGLGPYRLLAVPVRAQGQLVVVIAGASLEPSDRAVSRLRGLLALGGPLALLLIGTAGWAVATAALRPVEALRERTADLAAEQTGESLPEAGGRDEIDRLARTLDGLLDRVARARTRERSFVADASHELMTPLTVLHAHLELGAAGPPADRREALVAARQEAARLIRLARDLLVLARSDRGTLPIERVDVPVAALLDDVAQRARLAGIDVVVESADGLAIRGDRLRLEQALGNLLDNAARHGGPPVTLAARSAHGRVELHVRDAGHGFPPRFLPRAFERFARAERPGAEGSGLGLAIVATIAEAHGGEAHAANMPGHGADVWLSLPAASDSGAHGFGRPPTGRQAPERLPP
jgi:two-component system OmpR family sensor kinase